MHAANLESGAVRAIHEGSNSKPCAATSASLSRFCRGAGSGGPDVRSNPSFSAN